MFLAHSSSGDDEWEAVDDNELEHADHPSSKWCWTKRSLRTAPVLERFKCRRPSGCGSVCIPVKEQSVDYFYRAVFRSVGFSDSNYSG